VVLNPRQQARVLMAVGEGATTRTSSASTFTFNGPVTFGADMDTATGDLAWFAKYRMGAA